MAAEVQLQRLPRDVATITVEGTAPLIVNAWDQKAKQMILAAQQGKKTPKQHKDPNADFEASMYRFPDGGHGFPTLAFKAATVKGGGRAFGKAVRMTELRQHLYFLNDGLSTSGLPISRLTCSDPVRREDMVRVGPGTADIRYRAEYRQWSCDLRIEFLARAIDLDSIVALVDAGGSNGIGEWRPEKNGAFGTYKIVDASVQDETGSTS